LTGSTFAANLGTSPNVIINLSHSACPCTFQPTGYSGGAQGVIRVVESTSGGDTLSLGATGFTNDWTPPLVQDAGAKNDWMYFVNADTLIQFTNALGPPSLSNTAANQLTGGDNMSTGWPATGLSTPSPYGGQTDPTGGTNATLLTENTSTGPHSLDQTQSLAVGTNTVSVFAAPSTNDRYVEILVQSNFGTHSYSLQFDPTACTDLGVSTFGAGHVTAHGVIARAHGFCEGWIQADMGSNAPLFTGFRMVNASFADQYTGNGTSKVILWRPAARAGAVSPP
jgi:hypothetical protein